MKATTFSCDRCGNTITPQPPFERQVTFSEGNTRGVRRTFDVCQVCYMDLLAQMQTGHGDSPRAPSRVRDDA